METIRWLATCEICGKSYVTDVDGEHAGANTCSACAAECLIPEVATQAGADMLKELAAKCRVRNAKDVADFHAEFRSALARSQPKQGA